MAAFLVDASLPRPAAQLVRTSGHVAEDVRDIGMGSAPDAQIAEYARLRNRCLLTRDGDFGNVLDYPPARYAGIVIVETPARASRALVLNMLAAFMNNIAAYEPLAGKLIIIEPGRVRVRPG